MPVGLDELGYEAASTELAVPHSDGERWAAWASTIILSSTGMKEVGADTTGSNGSGRDSGYYSALLMSNSSTVSGHQSRWVAW
jgi:hypothetical protein